MAQNDRVCQAMIKGSVEESMTQATYSCCGTKPPRRFTLDKSQAIACQALIRLMELTSWSFAQFATVQRDHTLTMKAVHTFF